LVKRRTLLYAVAAGLAAPIKVFSQQQGNVRRIGFLAVRSRSTPSNPEPHYDAFTKAMRELGYVEGKNLVIEWRFADGKYERLTELAGELVRLNVEVIVTHSTPATDALKRATGTIPIVNAAFGDPVARGFAVSLARPGGNITGLSLMNVDLAPKRFELLKLMNPALSRAAVLTNSGSAGHAGILKSAKAAAQKLGVAVLPVDARTPEEIERGFVAIKRERADAVIVLSDAFFIGQRRQIVDLAARNRLPSLFAYREDVEAGGLMSYGTNNVDLYRRAAIYVDKILKGAKPGDLPIEQPTKIHLAINLKTAKALGLVVPKELVLQADEVFE
jgi:putative tryptophan/tyrosine transport system substrate-binding protein